MQSISCTRIIGNQHNLVRSATLSATAQRASTQLLQLQQRRKGNGSMVLSGPYTGATDSVVDVEVLGGAVGALRASAPVVTGVGNGVLQVQSIDAGAAAQTLRFTLLDAGTQAQPALLDFFGVQLAARAVGALGNAVALSVVRNLSYADLPFATLERITAGAKDFEGPQFDWGQPAATGADIPAGALRMAFAGLPAIHRAWKTWEKGQFAYHVDPPLAYDVPADTRIRAVSGDYTVTVTDGVTTEAYSAVTMHDFLAQVQARSALVQVLGVVAQDRSPGGQAVTDIPLRTDAHALPAIASAQRGSNRIEVGAVQPSAATQNITITCLGRSGADGQAWSVAGGVVGALPVAQTGQPYTAGPVQFTIPAPAVAPSLGAAITARFSPTSREDGEGLPAICFKPLLLGAAATDKEVTFVYQQRPPADCSCDNLPALYVSEKCLGLDVRTTILDPEYVSRLTDVYAWRENFIRNNTQLVSAGEIPEVPAQSGYQFLVSFIAHGTPLFTVSCKSADIYPTLELAETALGLLVGTQAPDGLVKGATFAVAGVSLLVDEVFGIAELRPTPVAADFKESITQVFDVSKPAIPGSSLKYAASSIDMDWMERALRTVIPCLGLIYADEDALALWDALLVEVKDDLEFLANDKNDLMSPADANDRYLDRYSATVDNILLSIGIVPKSDAGSAGSPCWRDHGGSHWWEDAAGFYLPAFTNQPFVSAIRDADGHIVSTKEFGFGLVTQCGHRLKVGDSITVRIGGTANQASWGEGDKFVIPLIGAASAPLTGGSDGDPTQTWTARSNLLGALPDWAFVPDTPMPWAHAPATVALLPGGIPFEVGDSVAFDIEGGRLRWRRDAGAWTEADLYTAAPHVLGDGLTLQAAPGAAPSFLGDDAWQFSAVATYGTARMRQPRIGQAFAWDGDSVTLNLDMGAALPLEVVMLALHALPATATVAIAGGLLAADEWSVPAAIHPGIVLASAPVPTARYLRIAITGAGAQGAAIGWLWAGMAWQPTVGPSRITRQRQYGLARGQGINPGALYRGAGTGGSWSWSEDEGGMLLADNAQQLIGLIDHSAAQGLEPLALIPDLRASYDASIALIDADSIQMTEMHNWQSGGTRAVSLELPLRAVLA